MLFVVKALVTGGTGFIGSHLVERLLGRGAEVLALVRNPGRLRFLEGLDVRLLAGDLFSIPPLPSDLDCVIHLAGQTKALKPADYYTVNELGTASLLESLRRQGSRAKVVLLSSLSACGPSAEGAARTENDPPAPVTPYGISKLRGEEAALERKTERPVVILRVGPVYGPRDSDFLPLFRIVKRGILPLIGRRRRPMSHCYVKDLVRALDLAARTDIGSGEIFNVADPVPCGFEDIGRAAARALGIRVRRIVVPLPLVYAAALASEGASALRKRAGIISRDKYREYKQAGWVVDTRKIRERLSFQTAYDLEAGIAETIRWCLDNGRL
jgi:dihydroflavonol-4-reductase